MIESVGLDIIELERISKAVARHGDRFTRRILTAGEQRRLAGRGDAVAFVAGRFAAKEAALKALGAVFDSGVYLRDIEITNDPLGKPFVALPERITRKLAERRVHVSITHSHTTAAAVAILERTSSAAE